MKKELKPPIEDLELVSRARELALKKHATQKDKNGEPYFNHLAAVAAGVRVLGGTLEEIAAAYLHDVVEDVKDVTYASLYREGFPASVVHIVWCVTKRNMELQDKYLARIVAGGQGAMRVKVADLLHNLRPDRLAELPEFTRERLLKKYQPSLARLLLELGYLQSQQDQDLATKPLGSSDYWTSGSSSSYAYCGTHTSGAFLASQLIVGDWVAGVKSPIAERINKESSDNWFRLENGEEWHCSYPDTKTVRAWPMSAWMNRQKTDKDWSPAQEKQYDVKTKVTQITSGGGKKK